jgi:polyisoprenoid-binding protein YceI
VTQNRLIAIVVAIVVMGGVGLYLAYDTFLRGDDVAALALPSASVTAEPDVEATAGTAASPTDAGSSTPGTAEPGGADDVTGTWTVVEGSEAGYRVREQLANLPAESDAVGRTSDVSGSITVASDGVTVTVTDAELVVDTTSIASDEGRRDNRLRTEGLETDRFPTATFTLTEPVDVPATVLDGTPVDVTLTGDLTLHGTTQTVDIPAQAQLIDGQIQVAGALSFSLADFDISPPNVGGFIVSIADEGTLEFLLVLARA